MSSRNPEILLHRCAAAMRQAVPKLSATQSGCDMNRELIREMAACLDEIEARQKADPALAREAFNAMREALVARGQACLPAGDRE